MQILWDEPKRLQNLEKHEIDFTDFNLEMLLTGVIAASHSGRFKVIGELNGDLVAVVLKPTGREAISIISMRRASRSERRLA